MKLYKLDLINLASTASPAVGCALNGSTLNGYNTSMCNRKISKYIT